jgi:biotin synthase
MNPLISEFFAAGTLPAAKMARLIETADESDQAVLADRARRITEVEFGHSIYVRGLIEWSNVCANDCYYCGIRRSNRALPRYRLDQETILACCAQGYALGFRTFVLQGGDCPGPDDNFLCHLVSAIKDRWPDCAVTLSVGERDVAVYRAFRQAGADRYLLRHETADAQHYARLHPPSLQLSHRIECLYALKELGFQVGAGFMVGSPGQTAAHLAADLAFLQQLQPQMVGIGPFLPHHQTPFAKEPPGSLSRTLLMLSLVRILLPSALLPATTALGTLAANGRQLGILAGANVVMPNLSPSQNRANYALYDNKAAFGAEAAEGLSLLADELAAIGRQIDFARGDWHAPRGHSEEESNLCTK